jgi:protein-tyrosine phosphatase
MAAAVARAMVEQGGLDSSVVVESFGTAGYHAGECADPEAVAALRRRRWPASGHRARRISPADIVAADLVLCADRGNLVEVRRLAGVDNDGTKIQLLRSYDSEATVGDDEVPDPWGGGDAEFDRALTIIERACRGLVGQLARTPR